jgi:hypothetical protein
MNLSDQGPDHTVTGFLGHGVLAIDAPCMLHSALKSSEFTAILLLLGAWLTGRFPPGG